MRPIIAEYYNSFPEEVQNQMRRLHDIIAEIIPHAEEVISYKMPAFKQQQVLVYYAGYKNHIGFYPTSKPIAAFEKQLQDYKYSKGAVQFPIDQPLPMTLIQAMVKFRLDDVVSSTPKSTARSKTL
jgi:uncharacterized protein YdhG (YjbR/CyaY superfamily)